MASDVNLVDINEIVNNEIILRDNLYTPFWNAHSKIVSSTLPLPYKLTINTNNNIYKIWQLNNVKLHSDIFNQYLTNTLDDTSNINSNDNFNDILSSRKLKIFPNKNQIKLFNKCFSAHRLCYNNAINEINKRYNNKLNEFTNLTHCIHENCNKNKFENKFFCKNHINCKPKWNLDISRQNIRESTLKKNSELDNSWLKDVPYDTREHAIMDAVSAYKTSITNKKFNNIAKFKLQFKSCHKSSQIFWITKAITPHYKRHTINKKVVKTPIGFNIFPQKLMNKAKLRFKKKDNKWLSNNFPTYQLDNESKIQRECGNYYLIINFKQKILDIKKPNIVASLDPGIRTFMTMFNEKGSIGKFGHNYKELLSKLYIKIDFIRSNRAKYKFKKRKRYNMRKKEFKLHKKIRDIVSDLHNKSASYLVKNYNVILLPEFEIVLALLKLFNHRAN